MDNLTKIWIQACTDKTFQKVDETLKFVVPINPEQFSQKFEVKQDQSQNAGSAGNSGKFLMTLPEELKLDFFLDGTKTVMGNAYLNETVHDQVAKLLKTVYYMNGDKHQPNFVKITWGKAEIFGSLQTAFNCQLKILDITYVLFTPDGQPLRAKISATFTAYIEPKKAAKKANKKSADLSHARTALPGDRLWQMTSDIYDDPKYVLQVAQANDLDSFRRLETGRSYVFPPFDRTETVSPTLEIART